MIHNSDKAKKKRPSLWLPTDRSKLKHWVDKQIEAVVSMGKLEEDLKLKHKQVDALKELIENNTEIYVLANQMISQALEYNKMDPTGNPEITNYRVMLTLIDYILTTAPEYIKTDREGHNLIGFPINAILAWCMGTPAGYAFFLNDKVNNCFKAILSRWCEFLNSPASTYVLNEDENGWMCDAAKEELHIEEFIYNPEEEHWGFKSWNDFFTRKFKPGLRPIAETDNQKVIVNACESASYNISTNVEKYQEFWLKGQAYSLLHMLNHDQFVDRFVGGTIYQAFLSSTKYHRWHSPVDGKIIKAYIVPGTYYSEIQAKEYDEAGPNKSQGYITHVATRAIIFIESDNPTIGLMCFMAVGMAEVSSCIITVKVGDYLKKGEELGYFQFGGSTHCLIFRKGVIEQFVTTAIPASDFNNSVVLKVNSKLATTY